MPRSRPHPLVPSSGARARWPLALIALALLIAGGLSALAPAQAQDGSSFDVQVRARLQADGDIEFALRADGQVLTPRLRIFRAGVPIGRLQVSSVVEWHGVQLQVTARRQADGDVEFGVRADGETVLQRQIFPASTDPGKWLVSRAVQVQSPDDPGDLTIYSGRGESLVGELIERFEDCRLLVIESNHADELLRMSPYDAATRARIASDAGHLSNEALAAYIRGGLGPDVRCIVLMHLSRVNNVPEIAEQTCRDALAARGRTDVRVVVTRQDRVAPTVDLHAWPPPAPHDAAPVALPARPASLFDNLS